MAKAAKLLGLEVKTSEPFSRTGSVPDLGGAQQLGPAFTLPVGQSSDAVSLGENWAVYRVVDRQIANQDDFAKQKNDIEQQLLDSRRTMAFEAFHTALDNRMKAEGKLKINADNLKRMTSSSNS